MSAPFYEPLECGVGDLEQVRRERDEARAECARLKSSASDAPPHHTFELTLKVGSCDWERVVQMVQELADHVADHGPACNRCGAGPGIGYSVEIDHDPSVTEETYRAALDAWCKQRREERQNKESEQ